MRTPTRITKPLLALLLALGMLLSTTACNDDKTSPPPTTQTPPSQTPTPTPSTPSSTPKPPPPTIPAAATKGLTVTSAEAFARFYLAATDHLSATGDGTVVRRWAMPDCETCGGLADGYEKTYRDGGSITGSTTTRIVRVVSADLVGRSRAKVVFEAEAGATVFTPKAHASATPLPGGDQHWEFYLSSSGGHWKTQAMKLTE